MKYWKKRLNQIIAGALAVILFLGVADWSAIETFAVEVQETEPEILEICEFVSEAEISAIGMELFGLNDGVVELSPSNEIQWIDRIDLTEAEAIRDFYDSLVEGSDNDGIDDYLIEDHYFHSKVDEHFFENNGTISRIIDKVTGYAATKEEISTVMSEIYSNYSRYTIAAANAFDRDHPEVFWLTGSVAPGCIASYSTASGGGYNYTLYLTYVLKGTVSGESYDIRDASYANQNAIKAGIAFVEENVASLVDKGALLDNEGKIKLYNQWLTINNEYNTGDLNNLPNDVRESICALEGRIGTDGPVCESYAKAFKVLCDRSGIPCVLVDGEAKNSISSSGEPHMWNYVCLEENWYAVDVTWNDPVGGTSGAVSGYESERWFLVGADTQIGSLTFIKSHPVTNRVSASGLSYTNGPVLSASAYTKKANETTISAVKNGLTKEYDGETFLFSTTKGVHFDWNSDGTAAIGGYFADEDGLQQLDITPVDAGTYYVKVTVEANGEYPEATKYIPFTIKQASGSIKNKEIGGYVIDGNYTTLYLPENPVKENFDVIGDGEVSFIWYKDSVSAENMLLEKPKTAGDYILQVILADGRNYLGDYLELEIVIEVRQKNISECLVSFNETAYYFTNQPIVPVIEIADGDKILVAERDYTVSYEDNILVGKGKIIITGKDNYIGTIEKTFDISYIETPTDYLHGENFKNGRYGSDVIVGVDGYEVSDTLDGTYKDSYIISEEGNPVEKELYFKQKSTGYITACEKVSVIIDKTGPKTLQTVVPNKEKGTLSINTAEARLTVDENGTCFYVIRKYEENVPLISEFFEMENGEWTAKEGVSYFELNKENEHEISLNNLENNTEYVLYFVKMDDLGNTSEVEKICFKTLDRLPFFLRLNGENLQKIILNDEVTEYRITIPYNVLKKDWEKSYANIVIEAEEKGVIIGENCNEDFLKFLLYKVTRENATEVETLVAEYSNCYDFSVEEAGNYRIKAFYRHLGATEAIELNSIDFNVCYAKRTYPVDTSIEVINVDSEQYFTADYIEYIKLKLLETATLNFEKNGETSVDEGLLLIKNSKNKVVTEKTKVTNGTYTLIYTIGEHEKFESEVTATLNITNYSISEIHYSLLEEDLYGRFAGPAVAFGTINNSPYTDHVVLTPVFKGQEGKLLSVKDLREELEEQGYELVITATENSSKKLLSFEDYLSDGIIVTANGVGEGKSKITIDTLIKFEGKTVGTITSRIENFIVASGMTGAAKNIVIKIKESGAPEGSVKELENNESYLVNKESVDRYYDLTETVVKGYDESFAGSLKWKSSNSKIATVTVEKNGAITLKIPKNAQGVAEITATAVDVGKKCVGFKIIIVDKEVRLDTTSLTMNSLKEDGGVVYLYPNTLTETVNGSGVITKIELLEKIKDGKNDVFKESSMFMPVDIEGENRNKNSIYDIETGKLILRFADKQSKAQNHTIYLRVTQMFHGEEFVSEEMKVSVKDLWVWPSTSIKASKAYESVYSKGYAEVLITTEDHVAMEGDVPKITMAEGQQFFIKEIDEVPESRQNGEVTWRIKLEKNTENVLPKKNNSTSAQIVNFLVLYDGYRENAQKMISTKITLSNKNPEMNLYGADAYVPSFYVDGDLRYVNVVLTIPEIIIEQLKSGNWKSDKKSVSYLDYNGETVLTIALNDSQKFAIEDIDVKEHYGDIPAKTGNQTIYGAIALKVKVLANENATLQFIVQGKQFGENVNYPTKTLSIKKQNVNLESIGLKDANNNVIKKITFSNKIAETDMAGKESIILNVSVPESIEACYRSNAEKYEGIFAVVEPGDKNAKSLLEEKSLIVQSINNKVQITTTEKAFLYKNCKLNLKLLIKGENGQAYTKSVAITLNFETAQIPSAKLTVQGTLYKGFEYLNEEWRGSSVKVTAKFSKMPVGYKITGVRFADPADNVKYILKWNSEQENEFFIEQNFSQISSGNDTIDVVYDVRVMGGETISMKSSAKVKIAETAAFKASEGSLTLYNCAEGEKYGKNVRFYDGKGKIVKAEIINETDLKTAGISYKIIPENDGSTSVRFYVDEEASRGIEKTYTVKVKVALVTGYENSESSYTGISKVLNVKINLKK